MVRIAIKTVGKRMVTLISGHEPWGLFTADELAEDLRHRAASSTAGVLFFLTPLESFQAEQVHACSPASHRVVAQGAQVRGDGAGCVLAQLDPMT